ncbi:hypothetical protein EJ04DRAFT_551299 [Polyplosphaeria fusca]|uniref:C2H2-type domain-containing protein n=1 Tax=Polyplosphaeria fusca TaxID=682080 RepID=A0A9P4R3Z4_9PLEO|nr:hypothetical protein EJ04DRAFT_551299 [Polyplosphaeria fusca]
MAYTQMVGIQHARDLLDDVKTPVGVRGQRTDQPPPSITEPPPQIPLRTVVLKSETALHGQDAVRAVQTHTKILSKRSSEIYKVDKHYIGLLQELPPPIEIHDKWDRHVRPNLELYLCQATRTLSKSLRDEDVIIEPVLCMAGKRCSPSSLSSGLAAQPPKDPVALDPMIWIYCGSKKCRKKVTEVTPSLAYVKHFERVNSMKPLHASLHAPWPAAGESTSHSTNQSSSVSLHTKVSCDIWFPVSEKLEVSGATARFTIRDDSTVTEHISTIGGLIKVDDKLYALTTAHPILNGIQELAASDSDSEQDTSTDDEETSSGSGSDYSGQHHTLGSCEPKVRLDGEWTGLPPPSILAYLGKATTDGNYGLPRPTLTTSDFALLDIENICPETAIDTKVVSDSIGNDDLFSGDVVVIASNTFAPIKGYLLKDNASIILRGEIVRTRKIQIKQPGERGWSGSWVVRDDKLCGMIYAAYDHTPYLHMLPIEDVFNAIREVLSATVVKVADGDEIDSFVLETCKKIRDAERTDESPVDRSWIGFAKSIDPLQKHSNPLQRTQVLRPSEEVEHGYKCGWNSCEETYDTLDKLNVHIIINSHGALRNSKESDDILRNRREANQPQRDAETETKHSTPYPLGPLDLATMNPPVGVTYVGSSFLDGDDAQLMTMFARIKGYQRILFPSPENRSICFVEFEDEASARDALNIVSNSTNYDRKKNLPLPSHAKAAKAALARDEMAKVVDASIRKDDFTSPRSSKAFHTKLQGFFGAEVGEGEQVPSSYEPVD